MADLTLRLTKGSALTLQELDSNFQALDSDVANLSSSLASSYVTLGTTQTITGAKTFTTTLTASNGAVLNGLSYPTADGAINQFITTNGSGTLSFATVESYDSVKVQQQIDSDFTNTRTTANLSELTNLYFTNARADARIAAASIFDLSDVSSGVVVTNLNADLLDGVSIASLLRSDATDAYTSGTLTFNSGTTLTAASGATVNFSNTTGTAPFTVASTTKVTNLNADQVDGFNGIGIYDSAGTLLNGA